MGFVCVSSELYLSIKTFVEKPQEEKEKMHFYSWIEEILCIIAIKGSHSNDTHLLRVFYKSSKKIWPFSLP